MQLEKFKKLVVKEVIIMTLTNKERKAEERKRPKYSKKIYKKKLVVKEVIIMTLTNKERKAKERKRPKYSKKIYKKIKKMYIGLNYSQKVFGFNSTMLFSI
jgi:hypothetical protein